MTSLYALVDHSYPEQVMKSDIAFIPIDTLHYFVDSDMHYTTLVLLNDGHYHFTYNKSRIINLFRLHCQYWQITITIIFDKTTLYDPQFQDGQLAFRDNLFWSPRIGIDLIMIWSRCCNTYDMRAAMYLFPHCNYKTESRVQYWIDRRDSTVITISINDRSALNQDVAPQQVPFTLDQPLNQMRSFMWPDYDKWFSWPAVVARREPIPEFTSRIDRSDTDV